MTGYTTVDQYRPVAMVESRKCGSLRFFLTVVIQQLTLAADALTGTFDVGVVPFD